MTKEQVQELEEIRGGRQVYKKEWQHVCSDRETEKGLGAER